MVRLFSSIHRLLMYVMPRRLAPRCSSQPWLTSLPPELIEKIAALIDDAASLSAFEACSRACHASCSDLPWLAQIDTLGFAVQQHLSHVPWVPSRYATNHPPTALCFVGRYSLDNGPAADSPEQQPPLGAKQLYRRCRDVLKADERFYADFRAGDLAAMAQLWHDDTTDEVPRCRHPGGEMLMGRPSVLFSWKLILRNPPRVTPVQAQWYCNTSGTRAAVRVHEQIRTHDCSTPIGTVLAVNSFALHTDRWRMVLHEAAEQLLGRGARARP